MLRLQNTLTRQLDEFKPIKNKTVGLYTCGPTVYNFAHIGNLRTFVFEDILKRTLLMDGYKVKHIMNITDVGHLTDDADAGEDKMEKGAAREGKSAWDIAKFYETAFLDDLKNLNIISANKYPRATDHIKEQIDLIKKLEKNGFTYKTADGVYFDTSRLADYGKLSNLQNQKLEAGKRVEMGDKKNPTDFALWKLSPKSEIGNLKSEIRKRQMEWDSPWGVGFPGWHLECSAMAAKYLGQPFDIHCGGIDHIPVHHTNEIAQSEAAEGKPLANYWMHGEFLLTGNADKMSKSEGNFITLQTLKTKSINPLAYRFFLLQAHYRKQLTFSWEALTAAQNGLNRMYQIARELPKRKAPADRKTLDQFLALCDNDLDLPGALALVWERLNEKSISTTALLKMDRIMGLRIKEALKVKLEKIPKEILKLADTRDEARKNKNWAESDRLRTEIEKQGFVVEDTKDGTKVYRSPPRF